MPRVDEMPDQVGNPRYISTLALAKGYYQMPMTKEDQDKMAFSSPQGLYQFTVMPFGLSGALATFQRMMDQNLRGLGSFVEAYLDDVIVYNSEWTEYLSHLRQVLEQLQQAGLTLKLKKCEFRTAKCTYLRHRIGCGCVRPEERKILAIKQMECPRTKNVRKFLGMTGYYLRFIQHYATIAEPLTNLTRKGKPHVIEWTENLKHAFESLKGHSHLLP